MPTLTTRRRPVEPAADLPSPASEGLGYRPQQVQLHARRSPRLIALGVLLACLGGLGGAALLAAQSSTRQVVVMAHSVARGQVVERGDVAITTIGAAQGVRVLPGSSLGDLVGRTAVVDLPEGSLPGEGSVGDAVVPTDFERLGLRLESGRVPMAGITRGTAIHLVPVAAPGGSAPAGLDPIDAVAVSEPTPGVGDSGVLLDVAVKPTDAPAIARLAALGQLYVVVVGRK